MRIPFQRLDGFSSRASFYSDYVSNFQRELESRLLSRILHYGVSNGLTISDGTTGAVTGVTVTSGLGYTVAGKRTFLSGDIFYALDENDAGKYLVVTPTQLSGYSEVHPITAVASYTKITDGAVVSAVVTPDSSLGQVRLGLIQAVSPFPVGAGLRTIPITDRDNLLASSPFAYVTIGPSGDSNVDFAGDDIQPFKDARDALNFATGGVIFVKKNVYDLSGGVTLSGMNSVIIIGEGKGTSFRGTPPFFRVLDNDQICLDSVGFSTNLVSSGMVRVMRTDAVSIRDSYISGGVDDTTLLELVSGISSVDVSRNIFTKNSIKPWKTVFGTPKLTIKSISFKKNLLSGASIQFSEQIGSLSLERNSMIDTNVDEENLAL